jgi:hypothetical protein
MAHRQHGTNFRNATPPQVMPPIAPPTPENIERGSIDHNLKRISSIASGQNRDSNGIYRESIPSANNTNNQFFIKFPASIHEVINEFYTGKIIDSLIELNVIPAEDKHLFVTATLLMGQNEDIGLKQPFLQGAVPYHTITNTTSLIFDKGDRSVAEETMRGSFRLAKTPEQYWEQLGKIIAVSILLSDYSFHSANIMIDTIRETAHRIDFGGGLRNIFNEENKEVTIPAEYQYKPWKFFTKNYLQSFKRIPGVFTHLYDYAQQMQTNMTRNNISWESVIARTNSKVPTDIKEQTTEMFGEQEGRASLPNVLESRMQQLNSTSTSSKTPLQSNNFFTHINNQKLKYKAAITIALPLIATLLIIASPIFALVYGASFAIRELSTPAVSPGMHA